MARSNDEPITNITDTDVMCGNCHNDGRFRLGNEMFRSLVKQHESEQLQSNKRNVKKRSVADKIIAIVKNDKGGRFLTKDKHNGNLMIVDDDEVRKKTMLALCKLNQPCIEKRLTKKLTPEEKEKDLQSKRKRHKNRTEEQKEKRRSCERAYRKTTRYRTHRKKYLQRVRREDKERFELLKSHEPITLSEEDLLFVKKYVSIMLVKRRRTRRNKTIKKLMKYGAVSFNPKSGNTTLLMLGMTQLSWSKRMTTNFNVIHGTNYATCSVLFHHHPDLEIDEIIPVSSWNYSVVSTNLGPLDFLTKFRNS